MSLGFPGMKEFTCRWKITKEKVPIWREGRAEAAGKGRGPLGWWQGSGWPEERLGGLHKTVPERFQALPHCFDTHGGLGGGRGRVGETWMHQELL